MLEHAGPSRCRSDGLPHPSSPSRAAPALSAPTRACNRLTPPLSPPLLFHDPQSLSTPHPSGGPPPPRSPAACTPRPCSRCSYQNRVIDLFTLPDSRQDTRASSSYCMIDVHTVSSFSCIFAPSGMAGSSGLDKSLAREMWNWSVAKKSKMGTCATRAGKMSCTRSASRALSDDHRRELLQLASDLHIS